MRKESEVLEHVRFIGERFATLKYARVYDQVQVDGFVSDFNAFAGVMTECRRQLEGDLGECSGIGIFHSAFSRVCAYVC